MSLSRLRLPTPVLAALALIVSGCAATRHVPGEPLAAGVGSSVEQTARELSIGAADDREKAVRIFEFVRDEIAYGFTKKFDRADPAFTLERGRGHCNPQTELFVALLEAAGIGARQHFVTIEPDILDGLMPKQAPQLASLDHSFAEVRLGGRWLRVDGYALDPALYRGATSRLRAAGQEVGLGAHVESCNSWDGRGDCMSQFVDPAMLLEDGDHGPFEDPSEFYSSADYGQKMRGATRFLYRWLGKTMMNRKLAKIRRQAPPVEPMDVVAGSG